MKWGEDTENILSFYQVMRQLVGKDTSADPDNWHTMHIMWGQCAVVALLVQDTFGGTLLNGKVGKISHYWNVLPSGKKVDLTSTQFGSTPPVITDVTDKKQRDYVLSFPATQARYEILKGRFDAYVDKIVSQVAEELGASFPGVEKTS